MSDLLQDRLENVEWKGFILDDIFEINSGVRLRKMDMQEGFIPFIGATDSNNGITNYVSNTNSSLDFNILGVNYNGSVVENFYHPYNAVFSDDVKRLSLKNIQGNKYLYLFLKNVILQQKEKYMYAYKFNANRMKRQKIMLPINNLGEPNWGFMEKIMREIEKEVMPDITFTPHAIVDKRELEQVIWGEFVIEELFDSKIGKSIDGNKVDKTKGETPYITRKETLNGLDGFIEWDDETYLNKVTKPVITIGNETAQPFIQEYDFYTGTKVNILTPKYEANKYHMLFVCISLQKHKSKYSYSFTINSTRLRKQKIMLPMKGHGDPDWEFMEQYMKRIENELMSK